MMTNITRDFHPIIQLAHNILMPLHKSCWHGANTTIFLAASPLAEQYNGQFIENSVEVPLPTKCYDPQDTETVVKISNEVLDIDNMDKYFK